MVKKIHEEILCGYKKCCPTVHIFEDGSIELTDDDAAIGSVGTIKLDAISVARIVELLSARKE